MNAETETAIQNLSKAFADTADLVSAMKQIANRSPTSSFICRPCGHRACRRSEALSADASSGGFPCCGMAHQGFDFQIMRYDARGRRAILDASGIAAAWEALRRVDE